MQVTVLSPCLLHYGLDNGSPDEKLHCYKISNMLKKLYECTNLRFQIYCGAPYDSYHLDEPKYSQNQTLNSFVQANIYSMIMRMIVDDFENKYVDLSDVTPSSIPEEYILPECQMREPFLRYLTYLANKDAVLFIGESNLCLQRPVRVRNNSEYDLCASTLIDIELTDVLVPYLKAIHNTDDIFPRAFFCSEHNAYALRVTSRSDPREKSALFRQIGCVVAKYNGYDKDDRLTRLNSTDYLIRDVYRKNSGKHFYLSVDIESGGFEVFDQGYNHLGQFNFSGVKVKPADRTHRLIH